MIYDVSAAYTAANLLLALILFFKSPKNVISRFYLFCVALLDGMGVLAFSLKELPGAQVREVIHIILVFCFSLLPFFFLHFIAIFVRRADLVRSKTNLFFLYFAGLFSYAMILLGYTPEPITAAHEVIRSGYLFYITWHSILFCIGVAILYEHTKGFYGRVEKANLLFSGFAVLLLILPGPFAETVFFGIFHLNIDWYFLSCSSAIIFAVYFIFRHKIVVNTLYDALKSALAVMKDVFILTDAIFKIQMARGAVDPLLHYSEKDLLGKNLADLIDQKDLLSAYRAFVFQGKMRESYFDTDVLLKSGDRLPMNFSFTPIYTNEEITGFVGIGRSVSELRHSEEALRILNHAVESSPECVAITSLNNSISYANKTFLETYGYKRDEVIGRPLHLTLSPKNSKPLMDDIRQIVKAGAWSGELLHITKQGHEFPVQVIMSPIYNERNDVVGRVLITQDITAKKQAELALQASEAKFRALFENMPVGLFQISTNGKFIAANPVFATMLGFSSVTEEFLSRIPDLLFVEPAAFTKWNELVKKGIEIRNMEVRISEGDRGMFFLLNVHAFRNPVGDIEYFEGTLTDITERKKLEDELLHVQRMESIGTLAGGIAHDFNNILQIILINSSKLPREISNPEAHAKSIDSITRSVHRGAGLVRQLMTFARKTDVTFAPLDVNAVIEELVRMLDETFPANIEINSALAETPTMILANQTQVHQVFLNLCVNARDAMPNGGQLTIKTEAVQGMSMKATFSDIQDQPYVHVEVSDSGLGMDESVRKRIFEPFYTTKNVGKGTGLGLAVVYGIIKNHHGFINVESEVGKGTTFNIFFPYTERNIASVVSGDGFGEIPGGTETVFVVEDEPDVRGTLQSILESKGYKVVTAGDGEEAIELYHRLHATINVVVLDMGLPKINGWQTFLSMKGTNPDVNAVLCSGFLEPEKKFEMLRAGIKDFIQKPYVTADVLKMLRTVLDPAQQ